MRVSLPPGPTSSPFRQLVEWSFRPAELLVRCWREFGDVFTLRFLRFPPLVVICDPGSISEVFADESDAFSAAAANVLLRPALGTDSLLQLDGEPHRAKRKTIMPAFQRAGLEEYREAIRDAARRVIHGNGLQPGWLQRKSLRVHREIKRITMDVILRALLGMHERRALAQVPVLLDRLFRVGQHPAFLATVDETGQVRARAWQELTRYSPWSLFRATRDELDDLLLAHIRTRRSQKGTQTDVLSLLLSARDEHGHALSDHALRDQIITLLVAGHKTTATALTWALYELASDAQLWMRLSAEAHAGDSTFLDAAIKESLRLHPTIPLVLRRLLTSRSLGGWMLPTGVLVAPTMFLAHRRPEAWDQPETFRPERFLTPQSPLSYFPFGGGPRRCVGAAFAMFEMRLVLTEILMSVRLELPRQYVARIARRGITFALSDRLPVHVHEVPEAHTWSVGANPARMEPQ